MVMVISDLPSSWLCVKTYGIPSKIVLWSGKKTRDKNGKHEFSVTPPSLYMLSLQTKIKDHPFQFTNPNPLLRVGKSEW